MDLENYMSSLEKKQASIDKMVGKPNSSGDASSAQCFGGTFVAWSVHACKLKEHIKITFIYNYKRFETIYKANILDPYSIYIYTYIYNYIGIPLSIH